MGHEEPDHECSTKRKTTIGSRDSDNRRTRQTTECHSRAFPYGCLSGRRKWVASRGIVGTQMGGCGFQENCHLHPALDCEAENWAAKNRSFAKANSDERGIGEITAALEDENDLQPSRRLGVCQPCQERYAAVLAKVYLSRLHQASSGQNWLTEAYGWHTFRHTFGKILNANGENPKVIQELMRHANLKVTMNTYVQAVT